MVRTLLISAPNFPPEGGGLGAYVERLAGPLAHDHGWRVVVVTSGDRGGRVRREDFDDLRIYRLPYHLQLSATRFGITWRRELKRIIRAEKPDLINAHLPTPGLADLIAGLAGSTPLVVTYHAGSMRKNRWPADLLIRFYERVLGRRLLARASWIIASSDFVRDSFLTRFRSKCSTVTPGVDSALFHPAVTPVRNRVLFVGGLNSADAHKGLDDLLPAIAELWSGRPELSLDVVGGGADLDRYQERARALGIDDRVRFLGRLSGDRLAQAYRDASVLALPTRNDSFPMVLLEAMASGIPVVSTVVGGIPGLVEDGRQGYLIEPGDGSALTDRLGRILDDPALAARLGDAGREKVQAAFSWEHQAAQTNPIFEALLNNQPGDGKRHVAIVAPHFAPSTGGLERYSHQLALGLDGEEDFDVLVLTSNDESRRLTREVFDGLTVIRFPTWFRASNTPISVTWPWHLRRAMAENRIDLVNVHTPVPFMAEAAALVCGSRPLVVSYHAGSMVKGKLPIDLVIRAYERYVLPILLRRAQAVVCVSPAIRSGFLADSPTDVSIVPPGVDGDMFSPGDPDHQAGAPTVLYVGRIERSSAWKGIDHLLEAFALVLKRVPDAHLVLVGDGDAVAGHRRAAVELGIADQVQFTGALTGPALVEAYRRASVVVLPSTSDAEAFGITLIEAMACGKPVIGSDVGGIPSVIAEGRDGFLVRPADPEQLAERCAQLLGDPGLAEEMGRQGYNKVRSCYTWPPLVAAYEKIFDGALAEAHRA